MTRSLPTSPSDSNDQLWRRLGLAFVLLGLVLRLLRFGLRFPLFGDEAFLAVQVLDKDFSQLAGPLEHNQVAPLLFLWAERWMVSLFGFHELVLRLLPCLASIGALLVFRSFCVRHLPPPAACAATAVFAVSHYLVRYGAEVKPYSIDLLLGTLTLALGADALRRPRAVRTLAFGALAALGIWVSFPAAFVAGGALLVMAVAAMRARDLRSLGWTGLAGSGLAASFVLMLMHVGAEQADAGEDLYGIWAHTFPPLTEPIGLVKWLLDTHTGHMFAHPAGGKNGASALTTIFCVAGVVALAPNRRTLLALLLAPFALNLVAAALGQYPYGGSARWMLHLAPAICALAGVGAQRLLRGRPRAVSVVVGLLALHAAFSAWRMIDRPYRNAHDRDQREFAREFWPGAATRGTGVELLCLTADLGLRLDPGSWARGDYAQYLCNQAIERRAPAADLRRVGPQRPLRCVAFRRIDSLADAANWEGWLARVEGAWAVVRREHFDVVRTHKSKETKLDRVEVLDLVPLVAPPPK